MGGGTSTGGNTTAVHKDSDIQIIINKKLTSERKQEVEEGKIKLLEFRDIVRIFPSDEPSTSIIVEVHQNVPTRNPGQGVSTNLGDHTYVSYWLVDIHNRTAKELSFYRRVYEISNIKNFEMEIKGEVFESNAKIISIGFKQVKDSELNKIHFVLEDDGCTHDVIFEI